MVMESTDTGSIYSQLTKGSRPDMSYAEDALRGEGAIYELDLNAEVLEHLEKQIESLTSRLRPISRQANFVKSDGGSDNGPSEAAMPEYSDSQVVTSIRAHRTRLAIFMSRLAELEKSVQV